MKQLSTLVEDIQQVLEGGVASENCVAGLAGTLSSVLVERLTNRGTNSILRMSNYAQPDRKLWYTVNTPQDAMALEPKAWLKFDYGAILEAYMLFLAKQAGHTVLHEQVEVNKHGITGHIDACIDGVIVDVKSASGRGFDKFKHHLLGSDDPFGYLDQLSLYVHACQDLPGVTVKKQGAFLAVNKENGEICLDVYDVKEMDYERETIRKRGMLSEGTPPPRCYKPVPEGQSGNLRLGVECSYCPFRKKCWPESRTFLYSRGPVHLVKVVREPEVPELEGTSFTE